MTAPTFFTVVADYKSVVVDLASDVDADPQLGPISAKVTFTPILANGDVILATNASPRPTGYVAAPITARIDTDGRLKLRVEPDGDRDDFASTEDFPATGSAAKVYWAIDEQTFYRWNGSAYVETYPYAAVRLLADTPLLELDSDLYYKVSFSEVVFNGTTGYISSFVFQAPTSDTELNLIEVTPVPGDRASGQIKIAPGAVRLEDGEIVFSFAGVDIPEPIPFELDVNIEEIADAGTVGRLLVQAETTASARATLGATATGQAVVTATDAEAARTAIDFNASVDERLVEALADEETVIASAAAAASTAATAEIAARNLVAADDRRIPRLGDDDRLVIRDRAGRIAMEVTDNGQTVIGNVTLANDRYSNGLRILDAEEKIAFEVRTDGTVYVGEFAEDSDGGSTRPLTVHVLIAAGQSNMAGAAFPTNAEIDPPNPRIFQFGASARTITTATVPLDMVDSDTSNGISPIMFIARSWLQRIGPDDVVLIIPGARGGTQLNSATATNASGVWNAAYTGASTNMYGLLKSQITQALAAIPVRWPGSTTKIVGMFWHQGEANLGVAFSDYNGWFDAIVADLRSHVSDSDMPVVLGGLVPEYSPANLTPRSSHVDTPSRVVRTGFAEGVSNGSGYNDLTHYTRQGSAELANRMVAAYDRALVNTADSNPLPPLTVEATLVSGVLTIAWAQPQCRYTGFTVEYSTNAGSTWTSITKTDVSATATASGVTGPVLVRVATINNVGTSATTTPVYATSGA